MSMKQTQTLSPQMMQSMEILQMGSQELLEYIENQAQENPVLEMEDTYTDQDQSAVLRRKLEWLESTDSQNRAYHQQDSEDKEVKDYLTDKVRQAKWVVHSIEQRRSTLLQCAQHILELQEDFFRRGPGHLRPMSLADVAQRVGVHESTVSRTVKDKYLQCASGVYPLSYFFSRSLGNASGASGEAASPDAAKALLKKLIAGEDKRKPLSDQKLCELMEREGCTLSRRTVAKYRDELNIPSTTGRRQYE